MTILGKGLWDDLSQLIGHLIPNYTALWNLGAPDRRFNNLYLQNDLDVLGGMVLGAGLTITAGGLAVTAGGITITAGDLALVAGTIDLPAGYSGVETLVAGTVTVVNTNVPAAPAKILLSRVVAGGTLGHLSVGTVVANTSFVIDSSDAADTSQVLWVLIK